MADEAAVAAPTATETAAPAAPAQPESIGEKMARLGWDKDAPHADVPDSLGAKSRRAEPAASEPTEPDAAEPEPEKPSKPKAAKPEPTTDERAQLAELAKKLGLEIEDGRVTAAERAQLRAERRAASERIKQWESEALARVEAAVKSADSRAPGLERLSAFEKAVADGDHEAIAKVAGFESYDKWQEHIIALKSDPGYKKIRALEEQVAAREKAERERIEAEQREREQREQQEQTVAQQRAQAQARAEYMKHLSTQMAQSSDPLVKVMSADPNFVGAVFRVQQSHWDGVSKPMSPEQAIRTSLKDQQTTPLMAELKGLWERLDPIFKQPSESAGAAVASVKAGVGKPAVPKTPAPSKKPEPSVKKLDDREWKQSAQRRLEEAAAEEARARRGARRAG